VAAVTRRAIGNWYADPERSVTDIAYQAVKYRRREGWVHRDLLRLSHPRTDEPVRRQLFDWISGRTADLGGLPLVSAFERAQAATSAAEIRELVEGNHALAWEMIPDRFLNEPSVWEALLQNGLPQGALMRQLPRLTRLGLLEPMGQWAGPVAAQLADPERLRKAHMHPINVLVAQRTYASGRSARGEGMWSPSRPIVDALDAAFYAAFGVVEPTGKRTMLAMDVSGSMTAPAGGMPVSCREASAALALITAATESRYEIVGFTARGGKPSRARCCLGDCGTTPGTTQPVDPATACRGSGTLDLSGAGAAPRLQFRADRGHRKRPHLTVRDARHGGRLHGAVFLNGRLSELLRPGHISAGRVHARRNDDDAPGPPGHDFGGTALRGLVLSSETSMTNAVSVQLGRHVSVGRRLDGVSGSGWMR
jgi:hypothetical protein